VTLLGLATSIMDTKQLEIACPCCRTRLSVDVRTGVVVRAVRPEQTDETGRPVMSDADWSSAVGKVKQRTEGAGSKLDDALKKEQEKASRLDDLFRQASEKLKPSDET
jgi:uncharacterized protein YbaR (Trm112 family)